MLLYKQYNNQHLSFLRQQAVVLLPTYIRDTTHLIQTSGKKTFHKDILLCTVDITNMYTNIPTDEGNQAAFRALTDLKTSTSMPDVTVLADLSRKITYLNSMVNNISKLEEYPWETLWPLHTVAYSWVNLKRNLSNQMQTKLNSTIKFTGECSPNEIHFLDATIYKSTNFQNKHTLDTKTYTKPTNKQTYVHSSS